MCPRLIHLSVESTKVTPKGLALFLQCHPDGWTKSPKKVCLSLSFKNYFAFSVEVLEHEESFNLFEHLPREGEQAKERYLLTSLSSSFPASHKREDDEENFPECYHHNRRRRRLNGR